MVKVLVGIDPSDLADELRKFINQGDIILHMSCYVTKTGTNVCMLILK